MPPPGAGYNSVRINIWVGVGLMKRAQFSFPLAPVRETAGIDFVQAAAREMHVERGRDSRTPLVTAKARLRRGWRPILE